MAIGVYFRPNSMTTEQYQEIIGALEEAGEGRPAGRVSHYAFGSAESLMTFDIWESEQAFDAFGKVLTPILEKAGVDEWQPDVMPIHHMIF